MTGMYVLNGMQSLQSSLGYYDVNTNLVFIW
jgi:hypothetical protein